MDNSQSENKILSEISKKKAPLVIDIPEQSVLSRSSDGRKLVVKSLVFDGTLPISKADFENSSFDKRKIDMAVTLDTLKLFKTSKLKSRKVQTEESYVRELCARQELAKIEILIRMDIAFGRPYLLKNYFKSWKFDQAGNFETILSDDKLTETTYLETKVVDKSVMTKLSVCDQQTVADNTSNILQTDEEVYLKHLISDQVKKSMTKIQSSGEGPIRTDNQDISPIRPVKHRYRGKFILTKTNLPTIEINGSSERQTLHNINKLTEENSNSYIPTSLEKDEKSYECQGMKKTMQDKRIAFQIAPKENLFSNKESLKGSTTSKPVIEDHKDKEHQYINDDADDDEENTEDNQIDLTTDCQQQTNQKTTWNTSPNFSPNEVMFEPYLMCKRSLYVIEEVSENESSSTVAEDSDKTAIKGLPGNRQMFNNNQTTSRTSVPASERQRLVSSSTQINAKTSETLELKDPSSLHIASSYVLTKVGKNNPKESSFQKRKEYGLVLKKKLTKNKSVLSNANLVPFNPNRSEEPKSI